MAPRANKSISLIHNRWISNRPGDPRLSRKPRIRRKDAVSRYIRKPADRDGGRSHDSRRADSADNPGRKTGIRRRENDPVSFQRSWFPVSWIGAFKDRVPIRFLENVARIIDLCSDPRLGDEVDGKHIAHYPSSGDRAVDRDPGTVSVRSRGGRVSRQTNGRDDYRGNRARLDPAANRRDVSRQILFLPDLDRRDRDPPLPGSRRTVSPRPFPGCHLHRRQHQLFHGPMAPEPSSESQPLRVSGGRATGRQGARSVSNRDRRRLPDLRPGHPRSSTLHRTSRTGP